MKQSTNFFSNFVMVLLLLYPILSIYGTPIGYNLGEILVIPISMLFFIISFFFNKSILGKNDPLPDGLPFYFLFWGIMTMVTAFIIPLFVIQCYLTFFLFFATFRQESYLKMYKAFAIVCIGFFAIQEFSYVTTGYRLSGILRFLPLQYDMSVTDFIERQATDVRSCSFFSEPAHFAQFLLPLFAIELFNDNNKKRYIYAIIIGIVLLFLQSGNGLFGMAAILFTYLIYLLRQKSKYKYFALGLFVIIIIYAGYQFVGSEMGVSVLERQTELSMDYEGGNRSGFMRIWRGFFVYDDYSLLEKIFGCPSEEAQLVHIRNSGMLLGINAELYFNAFHKILLNTGLVGLSIFIFIIVRLWRGNSACGKAILSVFIVISFIAAIYMSHTMILYFVLAAGMREKEFHSNGFFQTNNS